MSLGVCIPGLVADGRLSAEQGEAAQSLFDRLERDYRRQFGAQAAASMASDATIAALEKAAALKKRRALLQVSAQRQAWLDMQRYGAGAGGVRVLDPDAPGHLGSAAEALLARSEYAPYRNVEYQAHSIRGQAHATLQAFMARHRHDVIGRVQNRAELDELGRALFGEKVDNANATELADALAHTMDMLRLRRNAAGGDTGKIENYGLPQSHDSQAVADAGYTAWRDAIWPRLDRARMIDRETRQPFSDGSLELALRDVYETIASDVASAHVPGAAGRAAVVGARDHSRFLHFKSYDDWLAYHEQFGGRGTVYDIVMGHVDMMSREIAAMEILGPNPAATIRWLGDLIEDEPKRLGRSAKHREVARARRRGLENLYETHVGTNTRPINNRLALGFGALRAYQVATKLGSAVLSTTSDRATGILARKFNGLPLHGELTSFLRQLNPAKAEDRAFAVRAGLTWEGAAQISAAQSRMTGEELTGDVARRMAEFVLRVSGLNAVTDAGRWAFGMDILSHMTGESAKGWDALDPAFRNMFARHGFGEAAWDALRAAPQTAERGSMWILPENIADMRLRDQLLRMIRSEMDVAIPSSTLRTRAMVDSRLEKGTWIGEIGRTMFQFKAFPVTIMMQQAQRIMAQQGFNRATYAANMMILLTLAGAMALQMKEVSKGRDPRPVWDDDDMVGNAQFWGAAIAQGGGLGIFGDFLKNATNRNGDSILATLAGPGIGSLNTFVARPFGLAVQAASDDVPGDGRGDVNPMREVIRAMKSETPGGTIWYTRLAYERLIMDQLTLWGDNDPVDAFRRVQRLGDEAGTDFFWAPGQTAPARAPDFSNAIADRETNP